MEKTEWIWHKGAFVRWDDATTHVLTHTLHYGDGAFEGIRAYKTPRGPAIFRLRDHIERLFYSSSCLRMTYPYTVDEICEVTVELLRKNKVEHCYIRPLGYHDAGVMGLNPKNTPVVMSIACWPWGNYLAHDIVDVKESSFIRLHPKSTFADAKICANYTNSMLAVFEMRDTKYHEALMCDGERNVMEGPAENFFIVKNGTLHTPKKGPILAGITRATLLEIAADNKIPFVEGMIHIDDACKADEAFFCGTAAEVTPIRSINDHVLGSGKIGPVTALIQKEYLSLVKGERADTRNHLTYING